MIDEPVAKTPTQTATKAPTQTTPGADAEWKLEAPSGTLAPRSALNVLTRLNERVATGSIDDLVPIATGFVPMDKTIGGGLRPGELMLIGGAQGQGKTTMALQMARNMAASGQATVLYVCFEHDEEYLIQRMVAMESALTHLPQKSGAVKIQDVKKEVVSSYTASAETGTKAKLGANPRLRPSLERIAAQPTSGAWSCSSTTSRRSRSSPSPTRRRRRSPGSCPASRTSPSARWSRSWRSWQPTARG
jgi:DnaB-like helicase C terminal domain